MTGPCITDRDIGYLVPLIEEMIQRPLSHWSGLEKCHARIMMLVCFGNKKK